MFPISNLVFHLVDMGEKEWKDVVSEIQKIEYGFCAYGLWGERWGFSRRWEEAFVASSHTLLGYIPRGSEEWETGWRQSLRKRSCCSFSVWDVVGRQTYRMYLPHSTPHGSKTIFETQWGRRKAWESIQYPCHMNDSQKFLCALWRHS